MKFEIDTLVFIILAGQIVQGRIIECRKGERYIEDRNRDPQYQEYEVYRISKNDKIRNDYRNIHPSHSYKGEYDLSSLVNSDQFSTLIKDYEAYALEDGSVIGYFRYSSSQNVESSDQGDIVTGDGISLVELFVKTESTNMNKEWYMENMKDWSFFIISNYKQELIACYMESFMGSVE